MLASPTTVNPLPVDNVAIPRILDARCKAKDCNKLLARNVTGSAEIVCPRCQRFNTFRA